MSSQSKKSGSVASARKKLEPQGGKNGVVWDDGHHNNVKKVYVGLNHEAVVVKFEYGNGSKIVFGAEHGRQTMLGYEWVIDLESDEYIISVEGAYKQLLGTDGAIVTMLLFETNKKTYGPYGFEDRTSSKLTLKKESYKVVGFHGRAGDASINAIGAYFAPIGPMVMTPATRKLDGYGGDKGTPWDDGTFDDVRKVCVGENHYGIAFVKFEYVDGLEVVVGEEHGKETEYGVKEFEVDEYDYIVYVEGYRAKFDGDEIIKGFRFKTYKGKSSHLFGTDFGTKFVLQGRRIVGFHGRSEDALIFLGAYISSSSTRNILGEWIKVDQTGEGPGPRCSHALTQIGNKIYSFGGELTNQPIDKNVYVFDLESRIWSISPAIGDVPNLAFLGLCMVSVGSTLYLFGDDNSLRYNGFNSFDTTKNEWKKLTPLEEALTPRTFHSMVADENNVYVFGGMGTGKWLNTLDAYNIVRQRWVQCSSPEDSFSIRSGAGLQVVEGKVWVIYGFNGREELDDVYYYDIARNEWKKVETEAEALL